jgi:tetratricopeptide (TPR) repeat protein
LRPRPPRPPAPGPVLPGSPEIIEEPGKIIPRRRHARVGLFGIGGGGPEPAGSAPSWIWLVVGAAALGIAVVAAIGITTQKPPLVIPGATREQAQVADSLVKALGRDSLDIVANIELGNLYYDTHNFGDAVRYYRRALAVHPDLPDVRVDMAVSLHQSGHTPEALGELSQVLAAHPEHVIARLDRGIILEAVGRVAEAESTYHAVSAMTLTADQRDLVARQLAGIQQRKSQPAAPGAAGP